MRGEQANDLTDDSAVELAAGDVGNTPAAGLAVFVVEEHQVDIAAVIELFAAQFAERQDHAARRLSA